MASDQTTYIDLDALLAAIETSLIENALIQAGTKMGAARLLNINWRSMRYRLDKYGIKKIPDAKD